jgi:hypothetical protein
LGLLFVTVNTYAVLGVIVEGKPETDMEPFCVPPFNEWQSEQRPSPGAPVRPSGGLAIQEAKRTTLTISERIAYFFDIRK